MPITHAEKLGLMDEPKDSKSITTKNSLFIYKLRCIKSQTFPLRYSSLLPEKPIRHMKNPREKLSLQQEVSAIITGASTGIGKALAIELAKK
ncbi:MAG: hypothetical protein K2Q33_08505, partial [Gammaproteobacteria bacterium]|nr:hypothetical protein [Gammaproteobacteria bacterium]